MTEFRSSKQPRAPKTKSQIDGTKEWKEIGEFNLSLASLNYSTKQNELKLGQFEYPDPLTSSFFCDRSVRKAVEFQNRALYFGEWKEGKRDGKGKQVWKNGEVYEGWWKEGKAQGKGRLILTEGSHYSGQWKEDKFEG